jgi:hypothetical protein
VTRPEAIAALRRLLVLVKPELFGSGEPDGGIYLRAVAATDYLERENTIAANAPREN